MYTISYMYGLVCCRSPWTWICMHVTRGTPIWGPHVVTGVSRALPGRPSRGDRQTGSLTPRLSQTFPSYPQIVGRQRRRVAGRHTHMHTHPHPHTPHTHHTHTTHTTHTQTHTHAHPHTHTHTLADHTCTHHTPQTHIEHRTHTTHNTGTYTQHTVMHKHISHTIHQTHTPTHLHPITHLPVPTTHTPTPHIPPTHTYTPHTYLYPPHTHLHLQPGTLSVPSVLHVTQTSIPYCPAHSTRAPGRRVFSGALNTGPNFLRSRFNSNLMCLSHFNLALISADSNYSPVNECHRIMRRALILRRSATAAAVKPSWGCCGFSHDFC